MKKLSKKESERAITLAANGRDDDGQPETDDPVLGLRLVPGGARYRFEDLLQANSRRQVWVIGSLERCDIRIENPQVSAMHCMLIRNRRSKRVCIYDLQSTNGVRVNSTKIRAAELEPGDTLAIGEAHLYAFGVEDKPKDIIIASPKLPQYLEKAIETYGGVRPAARALDAPRHVVRTYGGKEEP